MPLLPSKIVTLCLLGLASASPAFADSNLLGKPGPDGKPVGSLSDVESLASGPRTQDQYEAEEKAMQEEAQADSTRAPASEESTPAPKAETPSDSEGASLFARIHSALLRIL